jgi:hypothetical protein
MIQLAASSFEILRGSGQPRSNSKQELLSGYVCIENNNSKSLQAIKDLCTGEAIDNVVIVYRDYAFSLTGVLFSDVSTQCSDTLHSFKFDAQDIHLVGCSVSRNVQK